MIISGKNFKKLIQKGIKSVPKKIIAKAICDYIKENKNRIIQIKIKQPEYKLIELSSDGNSIQVPITNEEYTIVFKPQKSKEIK